MGIAVGNTFAISPLFIFLAIQFLFLLGVLECCKKHIFPDERKFSLKEKSDILDMFSEIILLKLKKKLTEKNMNPKASHSVSAFDEISNEIANVMKEEIKKNPNLFKHKLRGSSIFEKEIQIELTKSTDNPIKNSDDIE